MIIQSSSFGGTVEVQSAADAELVRRDSRLDEPASLRLQDAADLDKLVDEVSSATAQEEWEESQLHGDEVLAPARIPLKPLGRFAGRAIRAGARAVVRVGKKVWSGAKRVGRAVWRQVSIPLEWPKKKDKKKR
nr:unnamed protein product [Spirometra erinaceieuropaei]